MSEIETSPKSKLDMILEKLNLKQSLQLFNFSSCTQRVDILEIYFWKSYSFFD